MIRFSLKVAANKVLFTPFWCFCFIQIQSFGQSVTTILGRPTDVSVTVSTHFDQKVSFQLEYGTKSGEYTMSTPSTNADAGVPFHQDLAGLNPNQRYYYRVRFQKPGAPAPLFSQEYSFHTQRAKGSPFTCIMEADQHLYDKKGIGIMYENTIANMLSEKADFLFSLGDMFGDDHTPETTTSDDMKKLHMNYIPYTGKLCHSTPFLFCLGNHEGENGYYLKQNDGKNIAVYGTNWRKYYFPNPVPNHFYSGNPKAEGYGMGLPENYYAFTWGDALFVVLDVYRHCDINEKPKNWDWTLGKDQYDWFKKTLEESTSPFKFVIAHHTRGQGRGGVNTAKAFEWGGYNGDNSTSYQFDQQRPGWGLPIHQLMVKNGVQVYFQGHDHVFAKEMLDGVVYQTLPMPSDSTYSIGITDNGDAFTGTILKGCGHLRLSVSPDCATIDYVASVLGKDEARTGVKNKQVVNTYEVGPCTTSGISDDFGYANTLEVFPNPAVDILTIKSTLMQVQNCKINLINIDGSIIKQMNQPKGNMEMQIDISDLPSGNYFVKILAETGSLNQPFQIIR